MHTFNEYLSAVNTAVSEIHYPSTPEGLYAPIAYTMALGGKRLRPTLVLMACDAFGGCLTDALAPAVGLELFHNFTLLHDDVMDKAPIRRGKPTVHCRWNDNTAILSGDAMLTLATRHIAQAPVGSLKAVLDLFNTTAMEIYEGQQHDVDFENRMDVTADEYIMMIRLKTSVLLGCACKTGAVIANASQEDADRLYDFGLNLGLAFQLQDDLLDVYGDEATFGKAIGGDISNNKKTFLLINALNTAAGADKDALIHWIGQPASKEKTAAVTQLYTRLGIRSFTESAIADFTAKSLEILDGTGMSDKARESFRQFAGMLLHRTK